MTPDPIVTLKLHPHKRGAWWGGLEVTLTEPGTGDPVNLSGVSRIDMQVRDKVDQDSQLRLSFSTEAGAGGGITHAANVVTVAGRVVDLPPRDYYFDLKIWFASGAQPQFVGPVQWPITNVVTRLED
jgi:hypothetical protein